MQALAFCPGSCEGYLIQPSLFRPRQKIDHRTIENDGLARNITYSLLGQSILLVLSIVAVKYVYSHLGKDALGIIYFTAMMNAIFCAVLEMGFCATSVREVSAHFASDKRYIVALVRTLSLFFWSGYALLGLGVYLLAPVVVHRWIILESLDGQCRCHRSARLGNFVSCSPSDLLLCRPFPGPPARGGEQSDRRDRHGAATTWHGCPPLIPWKPIAGRLTGSRVVTVSG